MKTSPQGRYAIRLREGAKREAYQDVKGLWTIGVGHLLREGDPRGPLSDAEIDTLLEADLCHAEAAVNAAGAPLEQHQFDACVSLTFNIGGHAFATSTVAKRLKEGNFDGAAQAFLLWDKPSSILPRRKSELRQFLTPYPEET